MSDERKNLEEKLEMLRKSGANGLFVMFPGATPIKETKKKVTIRKPMSDEEYEAFVSSILDD